ncbi:MAG: hypothetical protein QM765_39570 [Myxococcales bacterium]
MLEWIDYQGRRIVRMDVHNMSIEQYVKEIEAAAQFVLDAKPSPGSVLLLVCGVQPRGHLEAASAAWRAFQQRVQGLMRAQAVVGLTSFMRVVARLVVRDLYFASSEEDGKNWLLRQ